MHRGMVLVGLVALASCNGGVEPGVGSETSALSTKPDLILHDPADGCETRDYAADGDWYQGFCKTECAAPAMGLSSSFAAQGNCTRPPAVEPLNPGPGPGPDPGSPINFHFEEFTHMLTCNNDNTSPGVVLGSGYTLNFGTADDRRFPTVEFNWAADSSLVTGECDNYSAITGVATDHTWHGDPICSNPHIVFATRRAYGIAGARCSTLASLPGTVAMATNCKALDFTNTSVNELGGGTSWSGHDWDPGYHKAECGDGRFMKGIAHTKLDGVQAHATKILCCSFQYITIPG